MKNIFILLSLCALLQSSVGLSADTDGFKIGKISISSSVAVAQDRIEDKYFSPSPKLTPQELAAVELTKKWNAGTNVDPVVGPNGSIRFLFGAQQPQILCAVLQVTDIALQAGEQVNSLHLGDSVRWTVEPAISGAGDNEVQHLIVKPMDAGLDTSLVVTTSRRTYFLRLRSHRTDYMAQVSFTYPEESLAKWEKITTHENQERERKTIPQTGEYLGDLNFDYEISGDTRWKPVRVYNDGVKTIIEMPHEMSQTEAPTLLAMPSDSSSVENAVMVNYRVQSGRYIVDSVFDKAIMIAGVGSKQDKVTITRKVK